jgi:hemerythrin
MKPFNWDNHFITGLSPVDEQHHYLVDLINQFGDCLAENEIVPGQINRTYNELAEYAGYHFREEEALMQSAGIEAGHLAMHTRLHQDFMQELNFLHSNISSDNPDKARQLLEFLIHWLAYHILGTDKAMARQLAAIENGLSPAEAYHQEISRTQENDSTEPLLAALNGLFNQVSARNHELVELNKSLEVKVEQRTRALRKANLQLEEIALTDALTGLPNRRHAMRRLDELWDESIKYQLPLTCMMIDADHFKQVNDSHGHDAGDMVLRELTNTLVDSVRSDDLVCRLGGDEFFIICANTDLEGGLTIAQILCEKVSSLRIPTGESSWTGSVSVGVAARVNQMRNKDDLIKSADNGVYAAKNAGKNCVRFDEQTTG